MAMSEAMHGHAKAEQAHRPYLDPTTLRRRIKFHEFLIPGGVQTGYVNGTMTYSEPIDVDATPVCPWHDEHCASWAAIREGYTATGLLKRSEAALAELVAEFEKTKDDDLIEEINNLREQVTALTPVGPTIRDLRERTNLPEVSETKPKRKGSDASAADKIEKSLTTKPSWALKAKDGSTDQKTVICDGHFDAASRSRAISKAASSTPIPNGTDGWVRIPHSRFQCVICEGKTGIEKFNDRHTRGLDYEFGAERRRTSFEHEPRPSYKPMYAEEPDARDVAARALGTAGLPDEIVIEGAEDE